MKRDNRDHKSGDCKDQNEEEKPTGAFNIALIILATAAASLFFTSTTALRMMVFMTMTTFLTMLTMAVFMFILFVVALTGFFFKMVAMSHTLMIAKI